MTNGLSFIAGFFTKKKCFFNSQYLPSAQIYQATPTIINSFKKINTKARSDPKLNQEVLKRALHVVKTFFGFNVSVKLIEFLWLEQGQPQISESKSKNIASGWEIKFQWKVQTIPLPLVE